MREKNLTGIKKTKKVRAKSKKGGDYSKLITDIVTIIENLKSKKQLLDFWIEAINKNVQYDEESYEALLHYYNIIISEKLKSVESTISSSQSQDIDENVITNLKNMSALIHVTNNTQQHLQQIIYQRMHQLMQQQQAPLQPQALMHEQSMQQYVQSPMHPQMQQQINAHANQQAHQPMQSQVYQQAHQSINMPPGFQPLSQYTTNFDPSPIDTLYNFLSELKNLEVELRNMYDGDKKHAKLQTKRDNNVMRYIEQLITRYSKYFKIFDQMRIQQGGRWFKRINVKDKVKPDFKLLGNHIKSLMTTRKVTKFRRYFKDTYSKNRNDKVVQEYIKSYAITVLNGHNGLNKAFEVKLLSLLSSLLKKIDAKDVIQNIYHPPQNAGTKLKSQTMRKNTTSERKKAQKPKITKQTII